MLTNSFPLCLITMAFIWFSMPTARAETQVERGKYLMDGIVACGNCHTPKGPDDSSPVADMELAGGYVIVTPMFRAVVPNITLDKETGIGNWTDDQIIDAIRNGKRPDGTTIGPPMPIAFYRDMSDSDVRAIVTYLHTVKPIHHVVVEKSTYKNPLPSSYGPVVNQVPDVPSTDKVVYGHYLATALGHCIDCHTPLVQDKNDMTRVGQGRLQPGPFGKPVMSANLTTANPSGIASWTDEQVETAIARGIRPDRPLVRLMAFDWYKNISSADLKALVAYLRTLKPSMP
jgi:mono/diheme cytochrome c family protein